VQTLTKCEKRVLDYIRSHVNSRDNEAPSYKEIAHGLGLKTASNIHAHIEKLVIKGYLKKKRHSGRSIEITVHSPGWSACIELPLAGRIAAGKPIHAIEDTETVAIPADMVGKLETYALRVQGDSMIQDHVLDGDYVIVEKRSWATDGEMVVALLRSEEATLKRFRRDKGGRIRLEPANPAFAPLVCEERDLTIQGVVIGILRKYR
jgi:repressor LexA